MAVNLKFGTPYGDFTPDRNYSRQTQQRVLRSSFGDGYEQRAVDGLNPQQETFTLSFANRPIAEIETLVEALNAFAAKAIPFENNPTDSPGYTNISVVCDEYSTSVQYESIASLQGTFRRVYEP